MDYIEVTDTGCHEWTSSRFASGYGRIKIAGRSYRAHRVAWEMAYGEVPENQFVLHHCDNKPCVRLDHLFLGTHDENMADMVVKGRAATERNRHARLSRRQVEEIRDRYATGLVKQTALADEYGVTQSTISSIILGKTWTDVEVDGRLGKLSQDDVRKIRELFEAGGTSQRQLARDFNVSESLISQVILRKYRFA